MKRMIALALLTAVAWAAPVSRGEPVFDHATHQEQDLDCDYCHVPQTGPRWEASMPDRGLCLDCHEPSGLPADLPHPVSHLGDYRHQHQFAARADGGDCAMCHRNEEKCAVCHHGENVDFLVHDRNWSFTHPLTSFRGTEECRACHDTRNFCQDCHVDNGIRPGSHFLSGWSAPSYLHGEEARIDLRDCLACHGGPEPICKSCHQ